MLPHGVGKVFGSFYSCQLSQVRKTQLKASVSLTPTSLALADTPFLLKGRDCRPQTTIAR